MLIIITDRRLNNSPVSRKRVFVLITAVCSSLLNVFRRPEPLNIGVFLRLDLIKVLRMGNTGIRDTGKFSGTHRKEANIQGISDFPANCL